MTLDDLSLHLELYHSNSLVHLGGKALGLLVVDVAASSACLWHKGCTRIVGIMLHGKGGQRDEVDAVALFQCGEIGIAQRQTDDIADADGIACTGTHPEHVVVAPLQVPMLIAAQQVQNEVCTGATVIDIAQHMEQVDDETLNHVGDGNDEVVSPTCGNDGLDNPVDIGCLIHIIGTLMKQFLDDVREVCGKIFPHL